MYFTNLLLKLILNLQLLENTYCILRGTIDLFMYELRGYFITFCKMLINLSYPLIQFLNEQKQLLVFCSKLTVFTTDSHWSSRHMALSPDKLLPLLTWIKASSVIFDGLRTYFHMKSSFQKCEKNMTKQPFFILVCRNW